MQRFLLLLVVLGVSACDSERDNAIPFIESSEITGLNFSYQTTQSRPLDIADIMGGGAAFLDYDQDGDLDIYLVQGRVELSDEADQPASPEHSTGDQFFRNDSTATTVQFVNVTKEVGLESSSIGIGVAVGDVNRDGYPDVFLSRVGANQLLINNSTGQFFQANIEAVTAHEHWSTTAVIADFTGDNWPDIYVGNFVEIAAEQVEVCYSPTGLKDYCQADQFSPAADQLFINRGVDRSGALLFEEQSKQFELDEAAFATTGVIAGDFNNDHKLDLYVANHVGGDRLLVNEGGRRFTNGSSLASIDQAFYRPGIKSMGVDTADADGDGDLDLLVAHSDELALRVLENNGEGYFVDMTDSAGTQQSAIAGGAVSPLFVDFNHDGYLDVFLASGSMSRMQSLINESDQHPMRIIDRWFVQQAPLAARSISNEAEEGSVETGDQPAVQESKGASLFWSEVVYEDTARMLPAVVSRGAAIGDIDNDGDADILINNNNSRVSLLLNTTNPDNWVGVTALHGSPSRLALGAQIELKNTHHQKVVRHQFRSRGYASASDPRSRLHVEAGRTSADVLVTWPNGELERFVDLAIGQYHVLVKDTGTE